MFVSLVYFLRCHFADEEAVRDEHEEKHRDAGICSDLEIILTCSPHHLNVTVNLRQPRGTTVILLYFHMLVLINSRILTEIQIFK